MALLFVFGVGSLVRFSAHLFQVSQEVRLVDIVGVSGGGAACGAAMFGLILGIMGRKKD
jgi:hypothetical protein